MTPAQTSNSRAEALDAYLAQRKLDGYEIETRTKLQAIIVRRHRLHPLLRLACVGTRQRRLVVSVDEDCEVTTVAADPVRW